jgi:hypothetical protein
MVSPTAVSEPAFLMNLHGLGSGVDRRTNARISGAPADIAAHGAVDIGVVRRCIFFKQGRCRHDLPRLAVTALRNLERNPRRLHRLCGPAREALDGYHIAAANRRQRRDTGSDGLTVEVHGTGAA